jgi:hypothetical protein
LTHCSKRDNQKKKVSHSVFQNAKQRINKAKRGHEQRSSERHQEIPNQLNITKTCAKHVPVKGGVLSCQLWRSTMR